jgi:methyl-accepting chemotaxis protein
MDKVTQSNAANAEESASAAEELNAQAENLKEAVNELLTMVDGDKRVKHATRPTASASLSTTHRTTPHHSQPTLSKGKGEAKQNHNGATHSAEVAPQEAVKDRGSIPMENDFKDF